MPTNPYAADLAGRDPLASLAEGLETIEAVTARFDAAAWGRPYGPGKWTGRQLLVHLAQMEEFFGTRVRMALTVANFVVQPIEQDGLVTLAAAVSGPAALASFLAQRRVHLELFASFTPEQWGTAFQHPERGTMTVRDLVEYLAGHDWRHVPHLRLIAA